MLKEWRLHCDKRTCHCCSINCYPPWEQTRVCFLEVLLCIVSQAGIQTMKAGARTSRCWFQNVADTRQPRRAEGSSQKLQHLDPEAKGPGNPSACPVLPCVHSRKIHATYTPQLLASPTACRGPCTCSARQRLVGRLPSLRRWVQLSTACMQF